MGAPKSSPSPTNSPTLRRAPGYTVPAITSTAFDCATISAGERRRRRRTRRRGRRARARRPPDASAAASVGTKTAARQRESSTARTRAPPSRRRAPPRRRAPTETTSRPLARHRSSAARARTAPRSGGASNPSGPNDHQWIDGREEDEARRTTAIAGRTPSRMSHSGRSAATRATGDHQMAAKTSVVRQDGRSLRRHRLPVQEAGRDVASRRGDERDVGEGERRGEAVVAARHEAEEPGRPPVPLVDPNAPRRPDEHAGRVLAAGLTEVLDAERGRRHARRATGRHSRSPRPRARVAARTRSRAARRPRCSSLGGI